jgi:hypothetical protein
MVASYLNLLKDKFRPSQATQFYHYIIGQRGAAGGFAATRWPSLAALGKAHALLLGDGG